MKFHISLSFLFTILAVAYATEDFYRKHVINQNDINDNYPSWNMIKWNGWLKQRLGEGKTSENYGVKQSNSVISASPDLVKQDFLAATKLENGKTEQFWSNKKYPIYHFVLNGNRYDGWMCKDRFVLGGVQPKQKDQRPPYHFAGFSTTQSNPKTNADSSCTQIGR